VVAIHTVWVYVVLLFDSTGDKAVEPVVRITKKTVLVLSSCAFKLEKNNETKRIQELMLTGSTAL
jgi:hypothetical protein